MFNIKTTTKKEKKVFCDSFTNDAHAKLVFSQEKSASFRRGFRFLFMLTKWYFFAHLVTLWSDSSQKSTTTASIIVIRKTKLTNTQNHLLEID